VKALVVIDLQNDLFPGGAMACPGAESIVPVINRIVRKFPLVVATQDWHPRSHGCFAANQEGRSVGEEIDLHGLKQVLQPIHCVQGSAGAEFAPGLDVTAFKRIFKKGIDPRLDGFSAFHEAGGKRPTGLGEYLEDQDIREVFLCGLALDGVVRNSAVDAIKLGFRVRVVQDACRVSRDERGLEELALGEIRAAGATIISSDRC
jgi:nicotinamidase/pyrazinamidase